MRKPRWPWEWRCLFRFNTNGTQSPKERIGKLDFIKTKNVCSPKDTVEKRKGQVIDWGKIFATDTSDKRLSSKIYVNTPHDNKKINNSIKK